MLDDCLAVILAGGDSRRMGCDKSGVQLGGETLLQHVAATLQTLFPQTLLSARQVRPDIALPQICDRHVDSGPLAGSAASMPRSIRDGAPAAVGSTRIQPRSAIQISAQAWASDWRTVREPSTGLSSPPW